MGCNKILAIETSTTACSAALQVEGEIVEQFKIAPRQHSDLILPMVDQLLAEADITLGQLDSIAFAQGPGAFTGLRIAAGVVQGLSFAVDLPVTPVSTLATMAHGAFREFGAEQILVANDAGMKEVYFAAYHVPGQGKATLLGKEWVTALDAIPGVSEGEWLALGSGWQSYAELIPDSFADKLQKTLVEYYPHARDVVSLAQGIFAEGGCVAPEQAVPVYLRDKVVGN